MKRLIIILALTLGVCSGRLYAQTFEVQQLLLDIEKLAQLKNILNEMYRGYMVVEKGYTTIRDISQGNFSIHKIFLDGLLAVSPTIKKYYKVEQIIQYQINIVSEYKAANSRFHSDNHFSAKELEYISSVYSSIFDESVKNLNTLLTVLTDGELRASDDERLRLIDDLHKQMFGKLAFLRSFNNSTALLSLQRTRDVQDAELTKKLYGLP